MRKFTYCTSILLCIFLLISIFPVYAEDVYSQSNEKERILIKYKDDSIDKVKQNIHRKYKNSNFNLKENLDDGIELWEVNKGSDVKTFINDLQNDPSVEFVQPDYKLAVYNESLSDEPFDPYFSYQWGLSNKGQTIGMPGIPGMDIDAVRAWKFTKGDPNVVVGVLDSGIDINHPDIKNNIYVNKGEIPENGIDDDSNGFIDDVNGWDFYNNDKTVYDSFDEDIHGTHVSGIIAATSDSQGICGVAPNVKILPLKFMSSPDGGYTSDAIRAINYAKFFRKKVINCSWTGSDYNKALKVVMKKSKILFVCAAGNSGLDVTNSPVYPACFDIQNVLSVGAIENQGNLAYFSNFG